MGDALKRILNGVCVVVKRIDAPLVALTVVGGVHDAVDGRVTHIDVGRRHIDLGAQGLCTVGELAVLHALEEVKVFLHRAVAVGAVLAGLCQCSAVFLHLVGRQVANICLAVLDELDRILITLVKVVRAVEHAARGGGTQPVEVLVDGLHIFVVFLGGIGVVVAKVKESAVLFRGLVVDHDGLCRADVKIAVGLGGEAGVNFEVGIVSQILVDDVVYKITADFFHDGVPF